MENQDDTRLDYLRAGFAAAVEILVFLGMHIFIVVNGFFYFLESPPQMKRARRPYMALSCLILGFTLVGTVSYTVRVEQSLIERSHGLGSIREHYMEKWFLFGAASFVLSNVLGDALLLFRCYIIWKDIKWVLVLPAMLLVTYVCWMSVFLASSYAGRVPVVGIYTACGLSAVFNIAVTGLIVGRLLHARCRVARIITLVEVELYTGHVAILVESALPLCLSAIMATITNMPHVSGPSGVSFLALWMSLSAFCPQLIIYRVATGKSYTFDMSEVSNGQSSFTQPSETQEFINLGIRRCITPTARIGENGAFPA